MLTKRVSLTLSITGILPIVIYSFMIQYMVSSLIQSCEASSSDVIKKHSSYPVEHKDYSYEVIPKDKSIEGDDDDDDDDYEYDYEYDDGSDIYLEEEERKRNETLRKKNSIRTWKKKAPLFYVINPERKRHTATVIFLHDVNEISADWAKPINKTKQPYMKLICPTSFRMPLTIANGTKLRSWCNVVNNESWIEKEDVQGIKKSSIYINKLITQEMRKFRIPSSRIILAGIGQGGAIALYTALTSRHKLGAVVAFNSWLPMNKSVINTTTVNRHIPIFQGHMIDDPIVKCELGENSSKILKTLSDNAQFNTYPGRKHYIKPAGYGDMKQFMVRQVPPIDRAYLKRLFLKEKEKVMSNNTSTSKKKLKSNNTSTSKKS